MAQEIVLEQKNSQRYLLLGTGLVVTSMIIVPAIAMRFGLSASLTGALRIALMKASNRMVTGNNDNAEATASNFSCH